jgi:hypothetical protein
VTADWRLALLTFAQDMAALAASIERLEERRAIKEQTLGRRRVRVVRQDDPIDLPLERESATLSLAKACKTAGEIAEGFRLLSNLLTEATGAAPPALDECAEALLRASASLREMGLSKHGELELELPRLDAAAILSADVRSPFDS